MPITVTCPTCAESVAAPESMGGKKVVCPNCKGVITIPESFAPAELAEQAQANERPAPASPSEHDMPAALDIAKPAATDTRADDEKAAIRIVRILYVMLRDDWRRLFTCAHLWPVFFLFFLPWINISCNGRTAFTQSGWQATHGTFNVDAKLEPQMRTLDRLVRDDRGQGNGNAFRPRLDEAGPWSVLAIIYVLFLSLGGFIGLLCILCVVFRQPTFAAATHLFSLSLGSAAFLALALQMMIGFPVERHMKQLIDKNRLDFERQNPRLGNGPNPADAFDIVFDFQTRYTGWLWLSFMLTLVSAPMFLLEFGVMLVQVARTHRAKQSESG